MNTAGVLLCLPLDGEPPSQESSFCSCFCQKKHRSFHRNQPPLGSINYRRLLIMQTRYCVQVSVGVVNSKNTHLRKSARRHGPLGRCDAEIRTRCVDDEQKHDEEGGNKQANVSPLNIKGIALKIICSFKRAAHALELCLRTQVSMLQG